MINQLVSYEAELKSAMQLTDNAFLEGESRFRAEKIHELIEDEQKLLKYVELQAVKLRPQARTLYNQNLKRFRRKINEHLEFFEHNIRKKGQTMEPRDVEFADQYLLVDQNKRLMRDKMVSYENQRLNEDAQSQLAMQRQNLLKARQTNQRVQDQTDEAEGFIDLIQKAVNRRKIMFISLLALFVTSLAIIIFLSLIPKQN